MASPEFTQGVIDAVHASKDKEEASPYSSVKVFEGGASRAGGSMSMHEM